MRAVVLGAEGLLGSELVRQLHRNEHFTVKGISHAQLDVTDSEAVRQMILERHPDVIWNCVAYNAVDTAESKRNESKLLNVDVPKLLAELCKEYAITLVHFSTGSVFDGLSRSGYVEDAQANPQSVYAATKYTGELAIKNNLPEHYIIRLNWLFGPAGKSKRSKQSFPDIVLRLAHAEDAEPIRMVNDEIATPTYSVDLAQAAIALIVDQAPFGTYHLTNSGQASWYDLAAETLRLNSIDLPIEAISGASLKRAAKRPANAVLLNTKRPQLRDWREALGAYYTTRT
jgi:dTDP-4-dehydrorhamnose reductase